jgi:hypothetical protein
MRDNRPSSQPSRSRGGTPSQEVGSSSGEGGVSAGPHRSTHGRRGQPGPPLSSTWSFRKRAVEAM